MSFASPASNSAGIGSDHLRNHDVPPPAITDALTALARGDAVLAAQLSASFVAAHPEAAAAWRILGEATNQLQDFNAAEHAFSEAARHRPAGSPEQVHDVLLRIEPLICLGRPADAAACVRRAVALGPTSARDCFLAALAFSHLGLPADALPLAERSVALDPTMVEGWSLVGTAQQFLGNLQAAERAFSTVIAHSRDHAAAAYHGLAHLKRWTAHDNHIRQMEGFPCRTSMEASRIGYALFKEYDDIGDIEAAWDCLEHGARVARAMETWNDAAEQRIFTAWKAAYPARLAGEGDAAPREGPKRIFIVGLPRSGTTLVERILTAHSRIQTIGEVNTMAIVARRLTGIVSTDIVSPEIIAATTQTDPVAIANAYSADVSYLSDGSDYTIDKRPDNYQYVGLIKRAFPDAIVIVLDRHPMDALFGAYKRSFAPGSHGWSYTLDDLAAHYRNFRQLVDHWKTVLGDNLVEVSLEQLIANPEHEIRNLLVRCRIPFEHACLSPHKAKGAVTTASAVQVRQPINASGVGAWTRYRRQLAPLYDQLRSFGYLG